MSTSIVRLPSSPDIPVYVKSKPTLWERLTSHMPQKIIALICSLLLFAIVLGDRNKIVEFSEIPVEIVVPDGYVAVQTKSEHVDVTLHGRASVLRNISRDDLGVIRLEAAAAVGNQQLILRTEKLSLPEGVRVDQFDPEFIGINLEILDTRRVMVTTDNAFQGELMDGFQLGEIKIHPESIEIYGPQSVVEETTQLYIDQIDLTGKSSTFTVNRWVILNRLGLQARTSQVEVTVNIVSKSKQHVVLGVPIIPVNLTLNHEIVPDKIDLTLVGDDESLAKIDTSRLFATIDATRDDTESHIRLLSGQDFEFSNLPDGVGVDRARIPTILLKVWKNPEDKNAEIPVIMDDLGHE